MNQDLQSKHNKSCERQLIVCGFHRSGTSLTMQALKNAGLYVGDDLIAGHPSNPDGHFEDRSIVGLHNDILASVGRSWHSLGEPPSLIEERFVHKAGAIADGYSVASRHWGFKDPRTCLFLDLWHSILPNPAAVLIYRHYLSCYRSLRNRQAQILAFNPEKNADNLQFWSDPHLSLRLWLDHNRALLKYVKANRSTAVLVSCEAMLSGFDLVELVNRKFNLTLDTDAESGIRTGAKSHHQRQITTTPIPEELQIELDETLEALNNLADSPGAGILKEASHSNLSTIDAEYAQTRGLLKELNITEKKSDNRKSISTEKTKTNALTTVKTGSDTFDVNELIGKIELLTKRRAYDDAITLLGQHQSANSKNVQLHLVAGRLYLAQSLFSDAEKHFMQAHKLAPDSCAPLLHFGFLEIQRQNYRKAAHFISIAIAHAPKNARLYIHLCRALMGSGQIHKALEQCAKGLEIDSNVSKLQCLKIKLLIDAKLYEDADLFCSSMMDDYPEEPLFQALYSELNGLMGNTEAALHYYYLSKWKGMIATPGYRDQLQLALENIPLDEEMLAARRQVNCELKKLIMQVTSTNLRAAV